MGKKKSKKAKAHRKGVKPKLVAGKGKKKEFLQDREAQEFMERLARDGKSMVPHPEITSREFAAMNKEYRKHYRNYDYQFLRNMLRRQLDQSFGKFVCVVWF